MPGGPLRAFGRLPRRPAALTLTDARFTKGLLKEGERMMQPAADGPSGLAQSLRDLFWRQPVQVAQGHHDPLIFGQFPDGSQDLAPFLIQVQRRAIIGQRKWL